MRLTATLVLAALVAGGLTTPVHAAEKTPSSGWSFDGNTLTWTAPRPIPMGNAAIEFWDGDQRLGAARPKDQHTYALAVRSVKGVGSLQVRAAGRRLDVEPVRAATAAPAELPELLPATAADPGKPGSFPTRTAEYALDPLPIPGYAAPVEMQAVVVAPKNAPGPRPLVLFLHGRHSTCYRPGDPATVTGDWPCPQGLAAIPSYRGYLQAQQLLASQGYVTVSISANGVNAQDFQNVDGGAQARSALVRAHLAKWADGSVPDAAQADLTKVLLVGHSRGGEGVNRAAMDSLSPPPGDTAPVRWKIRGDLLIGPTIFGQNPAPDVPSVTFLPGCDGDVFDLQGQQYLDATRGVSRGAALHSGLYFVGADHNFFNSEWTPGQSVAPSSDDAQASDPACAPGAPTRLTDAQQRAAGATYMAATAKLFLDGDQKMLPLLDGSGKRAPSADPARVRSHAVGAARAGFVVPDDKTTATGSARPCRQITADRTAACLSGSDPQLSPHFAGFVGVPEDPDRFAVALRWSAKDQRATVKPAKPVSLAGSAELALRLAVPANSTGNRFAVAVTDTAGHRASLGTVTVAGLPGSAVTNTLWAQEVRVALPSYGVDLAHLTALELVPQSASGSAWLIDAHGWNTGTPDPKPAALPRVDVGSLVVVEGDSGTRNIQVPVTVTGSGNGTVRLYVNDTGTSISTRLVQVGPGQQTIEIPIGVTGNTRWSDNLLRPVAVKAVRGVFAGGSIGGVLVLNDDPEPTITITPVADRVTEGGVLRWRMTLSEPADSEVWRAGFPLAPGTPELSTTDVDPAWFRQNASESELPSRPLSASGLVVFAIVPPGQLSADFDIPTISDTESEPAEQVHLLLRQGSPDVPRFEVTGTVTDN